MHARVRVGTPESRLRPASERGTVNQIQYCSHRLFAVFFQYFTPSAATVLKRLTTHRVRTLMNFTCSARCTTSTGTAAGKFTFQRISNACNQRFRQQPFKTDSLSCCPTCKTNTVALAWYSIASKVGVHYFPSLISKVAGSITATLFFW